MDERVAATGPPLTRRVKWSARRLQVPGATVSGMTTALDTTPTPAWRPALVAAGAALLAGGALHPDSDAADSMRDELATMTAHDNWVLSHALLAVGVAVLVVGLSAARRARAFPSAAARPLGFAIAALALYFVETVLHLAAAVDSHELHHGDAAPVAFTHLGLAAVLYPVSGLAVAWLALALVRAQTGLRRGIAVVGLVAGLAHAVSVPLTLLFPDTEFSPVFAVAGVLLAVWAIGTAAAGSPARQVTTDRDLARVG